MSTTMGKAESTWGGGGEFSDFGFLKKEDKKNQHIIKNLNNQKLG